MSDAPKPELLTPDFRLHCLEVAERTVYYSKESAAAGSYANPVDKPMREIFDRADRIAQYCANAEVPSSLIEKLRSALCSST